MFNLTTTLRCLWKVREKADSGYNTIHGELFMPPSKSSAPIALALLGALTVILVSGLWPFNPFPANHLTWLKEENGLEFEEEAILVSRGPFDFSGPDWSSISLEFWLQPRSNWRNTTTFFRHIHSREPQAIPHDAIQKRTARPAGEEGRRSTGGHRDRCSYLSERSRIRHDYVWAEGHLGLCERQ